MSRLFASYQLRSYLRAARTSRPERSDALASGPPLGAELALDFELAFAGRFRWAGLMDLMLALRATSSPTGYSAARFAGASEYAPASIDRSIGRARSTRIRSPKTRAESA